MSLESQDKFIHEAFRNLVDGCNFGKRKYVVIKFTYCPSHCIYCKCEEVSSLEWEIKNPENKDFLSIVKEKFNILHLQGYYQIIAILPEGNKYRIGSQADFYNAFLFYLDGCSFEGAEKPLNVKVLKKIPFL